MPKIKILNIVGARPNFMKIAPLMAAYRQFPEIEPMLVHTGQHYDEKMSHLFFRQLQIPEPQINLGVGGGSHASQTAAIMTAFEPIVLEHRPDAVLVVGDVNSTVACGIVAVKLGVKLIHVEAGLRSFDRSMPEEINRVLTDAISDLLFCTEQSGMENLRREGISPDKMHLVGNVMIDTLLEHRSRAESSKVLEELGLHEKKYAVVTLHRPSNVDDPASLKEILKVLDEIGKDLPVIFPIHPRTRQRMSAFGINGTNGSLCLIDPVGYLDFLKLMSAAKLVMTDSGGIQEETTILKVPCLTLRENTERPVTVGLGTNRLVGRDPEQILAAYRELKNEPLRKAGTPPLWDGHAAKRIVNVIEQKL